MTVVDGVWLMVISAAALVGIGMDWRKEGIVVSQQSAVNVVLVVEGEEEEVLFGVVPMLSY